MIRKAQSADLSPILALLDRAFGGSPYESKLVRLLVQRDRPMHHWVALAEGQLVGYIAYTRAFREEDPIGWHLAPLAVEPEWQGRGWGSRLVRESLHELGEEPVFVLGDPRYYTRFGFEVINRPRSAFDPEGGHFQALNWTPVADSDFTIGYEPEFLEE